MTSWMEKEDARYVSANLKMELTYSGLLRCLTCGSIITEEEYQKSLHTHGYDSFEEV